MLVDIKNDSPAEALLSHLEVIEQLHQLWAREGDELIMPTLERHLRTAHGLANSILIGNKYLTEGAD